MNHLLSRHQQLSDQSRINVVMARTAHRALKSYFGGEIADFSQLNTAVLGWLESHGFIERVQTSETQVSYLPTRKAYRAMLVAA